MAKGTKTGGGSRKGKQNKATIEFKEALNELLNQAAPDMVTWLGQIDDPFKRFDILSRFAEFIHPKLARTEHTGDKDNPIKSVTEIRITAPKE